MFDTITAKLTSRMSNLSNVGAIIFFIGLIAATGFFIVGIEPAGTFLFSGKVDSTAGVWTVMVASFFGGYVSHYFEAERRQWESKTVITRAEAPIAGLMWDGVHMASAHEDSGKPGWIGVCVFVLVLLINAGFDLSWFDVSRSLPVLRPAKFSARDPALFEGELRQLSRDEPGSTRTLSNARRRRC